MDQISQISELNILLMIQYEIKVIIHVISLIVLVMLDISVVLNYVIDKIWRYMIHQLMV